MKESTKAEIVIFQPTPPARTETEMLQDEERD